MLPFTQYVPEIDNHLRALFRKHGWTTDAPDRITLATHILLSLQPQAGIEDLSQQQDLTLHMSRVQNTLARIDFAFTSLEENPYPYTNDTHRLTEYLLSTIAFQILGAQGDPIREAMLSPQSALREGPHLHDTAKLISETLNQFQKFNEAYLKNPDSIGVTLGKIPVEIQILFELSALDTARDCQIWLDNNDDFNGPASRAIGKEFEGYFLPRLEKLRVYNVALADRDSDLARSFAKTLKRIEQQQIPIARFFEPEAQPSRAMIPPFASTTFSSSASPSPIPSHMPAIQKDVDRFFRMWDMDGRKEYAELHTQLVTALQPEPMYVNGGLNTWHKMARNYLHKIDHAFEYLKKHGAPPLYNSFSDIPQVVLCAIAYDHMPHEGSLTTRLQFMKMAGPNGEIAKDANALVNESRAFRDIIRERTISENGMFESLRPAVQLITELATISEANLCMQCMQNFAQDNYKDPYGEHKDKIVPFMATLRGYRAVLRGRSGAASYFDRLMIAVENQYAPIARKLGVVDTGHTGAEVVQLDAFRKK